VYQWKNVRKYASKDTSDIPAISDGYDVKYSRKKRFQETIFLWDCVCKSVQVLLSLEFLMLFMIK